jgi:regulator of RNase E activity RraA
MALKPGTRDKLKSVGTADVAAALAKRGLRRQSVPGLRPVAPFQDVLVGEAAKAITSCPAGGVLVMEGPVPPVPVALLQRRRVAGIVADNALRNAVEIARAGVPAYHRPPGASSKALPISAGDVIMGDGKGVVIIPAALADDIAEEAVEAMAFAEFMAEQVNAGGGVYGLHIPSGEQARTAFAAWRRMKGR